MSQLGVLIMAAGKGTRMKSDQAKVLHRLAGRPLVKFPEARARELGADRVIAVVGHQAEEVRKVLEPETIAVLQAEQLGTGHAVQCAAKAFQDLDGDLMVLSGDVPLIQLKTLRALIESRRASGAAAALLTAVMEKPAAYGRVFRNARGHVERIVEAKDATAEELKTKEVSMGTYVFKINLLLEGLKTLSNDNAQGEYYLPDVILDFCSRGEIVAASVLEDLYEAHGINTPEELAMLEERAASGKYLL